MPQWNSMQLQNQHEKHITSLDALEGPRNPNKTSQLITLQFWIEYLKLTSAYTGTSSAPLRCVRYSTSCFCFPPPECYVSSEFPMRGILASTSISCASRNWSSFAPGADPRRTPCQCQCQWVSIISSMQYRDQQNAKQPTSSNICNETRNALLRRC